MLDQKTFVIPLYLPATPCRAAARGVKRRRGREKKKKGGGPVAKERGHKCWFILLGPIVPVDIFARKGGGKEKGGKKDIDDGLLLY